MSFQKSLNEPLICADGEEAERKEMPSMYESVMTVCKLSVWPVIGALFHPAYTIVNAAVCGRLGDPVYLSGFGLGSLTLGIGAIAILVCFAMGLGTVVGQASGSKDYALCRVFLYRQYFLNCLAFAVITIPMIFIRSIYTAIGQDEETAELATKYVRIVYPFLIFHSQSFANFQYAMTLESTIIMVISIASASLAHLVLTLLFVLKFDMGFDGVCWATAAHFFVRWLASQVFLWTTTNEKITCTRGQPAFKRSTFTDLGFQTKLGLATMAMGIWSWWAFDVFTLIASYQTTEIMSAQTIMRSLGLLTFMIPVGFATASNILISKNIGERNEFMLTHYFRVAMGLSVCVALFQVFLLIVFEESFMSIFTTEVTVLDQMKLAWPIFMLFVIFDTTQGIAMSAIRASGQQKKGAIITCIAYWVIGIPVSCYLVYKKEWGIFGIWCGPSLAVFFNTVVYLAMFVYTPWQQLMEEAAKRREKQKQFIKEQEAQEAEETTDSDFRKVQTEDQ